MTRYVVGSLVGVALVVASVIVGHVNGSSGRVEEPSLCDGEQLQRDFIRSLAREVGFRGRSVFDAHDYGYAPPLWMTNSPVGPVLAGDAEGSGE